MKTKKMMLTLGLLISASALQSAVPTYADKAISLIQGPRNANTKMFYLSTTPGDMMTIEFKPEKGDSITYNAKHGSTVNMSTVHGHGTFHITYKGKKLSPIHVRFNNPSYVMTGTLEQGHLLIEFWSPIGERIQSKKIKI